MLFNIALEKVKYEFPYNKQKAIIEKAGHWATSTISLRPRTIFAIKKDYYLSEIFSEKKALVIQFARLYQKKIAKIFFNRFRFINLYKHHLIRGRDNFYHNHI